MTNVTKLVTKLEGEFVSLLKDAESLVLIGKTEDDIKLMTNVSNSEAIMIIEAMKLEMLSAYLDDVLESQS
tara:strand:- start:19 stop:231 length:213 start_codon:yes stop_codon:yes gene_type:complete